MTFCLPPDLVTKFKKALTSGKLNPAKMAEMTTVKRKALLTKVVGENADQVNLLFEKKLLLKNQKRGFVTWAKSVTGIKEPARRDLISRVEKLEDALSPNNRSQFVNDLVDQKLGIHVSPKEAAKITEITSEMDKLYQKGVAKVKAGAGRREVRGELPKEWFAKQRELENYIDAQTPIAWKSAGWVTEIGTTARTLKATMDVSFVMRQASNYFGRKEWLQAVGNIRKYAVSDDAVDSLAVDIMSHKFGDEAMSRKRLLGLTIFGEKITQKEEAFMSRWAEKIPGVAISERANVGMINDLRANRFLNTVAAFERAGKKLSSKEMDELAQTIAAATGRGTLGTLEAAAKPLAVALFSPRFFAARVITILKPFQPGISKVARIEAAKNLGTMIALATGMLGLAKMAGADVETDPRSSGFGKATFGTTRFDLTGGNGQFIRLVIQAMTQSTKSTTTGKITKLNTGQFGSRNTWDLLTGFIENKTAPLMSAIKEIIKGETFAGDKVHFDAPTALYFVRQLTVPLIFDAVYEAYKESGGNLPLAAGVGVAEFVGLGVNSYGYTPGAKEWKELERKQGKDSHDRAVAELNKALVPRLKEVQDTAAYKSRDISEQNKIVDTIIAQESKKILDKYKIAFKEPTSRAEGVKLLKAVSRGELGDWADDGSFIDDIVLYARAIGTDPITAFQRIATKQKIRRIDNGAIIVYRIPVSVSSQVKRELGAGKGEILEHMVPLVIGGSNSRSNLQLVSKADHDRWTPVEIKLGKMLRSGKITKKEAQRRILLFKQGKLSRAQTLK